MGLGQQDIGLQVNDFRTPLPLRDTPHLTMPPCQNTLSVSLVLLRRQPNLSLMLRPSLPRQCGGAQRRTRPRTLKRRRQRRERTSQAGPSNRTGAQAVKKRKPGSRVTKDFGGDGETLTNGAPGSTGTGFGKRAQRYMQATDTLDWNSFKCTVTGQGRSVL